MISLKSVTEKSITLKNGAVATKTRKRLWLALAALAALQLYFVREMLAALLIFTMLFAVVAVFAVLFLVLDFAGRRTAVWAEPHTKQAAELAQRVGHRTLAWAEPQTKVAAGYARRAWTAAELSTMEYSRKLLDRWNAQRPHGA